MTNSTIVKTVMFTASRQTVWGFLTEKDKLATWFHPAEADLAEGAEFALLGTADDGQTERICWGSVLEMKPPSRLKYTFTIKPLGGHMTTVTWQLDEMHGGTRLTLQHEGFEAAGDDALGLLTAIDAGWDRHFGTLREAVAA